MAFDSKITFEKHLRSVSTAASQRLGILRKSWRMFHDRSFLVRCFRGFVLPVLEYCSAVWCSAADTHLELLDRAVSGARFLTGCVFECDIAHRRSVAVLCILYKIRCKASTPSTADLVGRLPTGRQIGRPTADLVKRALQTFLNNNINLFYFFTVLGSVVIKS